MEKGLATVPLFLSPAGKPLVLTMWVQETVFIYTFLQICALALKVKVTPFSSDSQGNCSGEEGSPI